VKKHLIPLVALFAAGIVASFALAAPPPGKGPKTSTSTATSGHGKSGSKAKCKPLNLKGTVAGGTIQLDVTKAAGPQGKQLVGTAASLTVTGNVSVQAWSCSTPGSTAAPQLQLRQLHAGGSPHPSTTTTSP
jgi:hypothetical protein